MTSAAILDADTAAFLLGAVSINAASCGGHATPAVVRASGCRISRDRRTVTLFLARSKASALLEAVRTSASIAVVFSRPSSHRSLQLKGSDASVGAAARADHALVERYIASFAHELERIGYNPALARALLGIDPDELSLVRFTPSAAFTQTPGPGAGAPLSIAR